MKIARFLTTMIVTLCVCSFAAAETISVAAAVSLKEAITEIADQYEKQTGDHVTFVFGASGQLSNQIHSGAPVDLFISAANKQIDELIKSGDLLDSTRKVICGNELVLIVPAGSTSQLHNFADLGKKDAGKFSIGEPKTVPAGQYAMQVLDKLHLTSQTADRIVYGASVRQVLNYVERGEVAAGIVYSTDAQVSGANVKIVATADAKDHEPIVYPAAIVKASTKQDAAEKFLHYLGGDKAQAVLVAHGFSVSSASAAPTTAPDKEIGK